MFERLSGLAEEYAKLEQDLSDAAVHSDPERARALGRRYGELTPVVHAYQEWQQTSADEQTARELAAEDHSFAAEADEFARHRAELEGQIAELLAPRDPNDSKDVLLEVKAGEGGEESALFAGDLLRMYLRYAERRGWRAELMSAHEGEHGGYKEAVARVEGTGAYAALKFESGTHRVQRVPVTEASGRIHTSAATVAILPEMEEIEDVELRDADLKVDTFRASGAGGQHVNKTDSAIRITHLPSGIVVECQDERSQHKNRARALSLLKARLLDSQRAEQAAKQAATRKLQVGSGDRSQRIRTYNFPQGRVTDHRINLTLHQLPQILDGNLDDLIGALARESHAEALAALGDAP